ncbi:MAG: acetylglutamate kinase [Chloroflexi bacterium]|nr:acetylglutamate kinase [Chloroflexota bacterium]MBV9596518.1 acetylglutamate kinase [Chloroflexota bacterium]
MLIPPEVRAADDKTSVLLEALPYICEYVRKTIAVKVGGSVGEEGTVLDDVVWLKRLGINPVLVHGGGPQISQRLDRLGVETRFVEGRRFTDQQTLEVVHEVLMRINGEFVSYLNAHGVSAWGCNGLDGQMVHARYRDERLGFVGEVEAVNLRPITSLVEQGYVVVIAPLAAGPGSQPLNVNADTVAGEVARAIRAQKLVLFTDVQGVLDAQGQVLPELSRAQVEGMLEDGTIRGGMIPKIQACLRALDTVPRVHVLDGRVPHALIRELFTREGVGTMLTSQLPEEEGVLAS